MRTVSVHSIVLFVTLPLFVVMLSWGGLWELLLAPFYPDISEYLYPRVSLWQLTGEHFLLVFVSSLLSIVIGTGLGILVTRSFGRDFLPALDGLVSIGQTFPPVAVLALAVPALGFGYKPTIAALFLYGLLPVVRNTISGLQAVNPEVREAAAGMGMSEMQTLWQVEIPLSLPVIMAGIKTSVIVNIGTATIGATIGAGGLGAPIITGLAADNPAFILQGSIIAALFAMIVDAILEIIEHHLSVRS